MEQVHDVDPSFKFRCLASVPDDVLLWSVDMQALQSVRVESYYISFLRWMQTVIFILFGLYVCEDCLAREVCDPSSPDCRARGGREACAIRWKSA